MIHAEIFLPDAEATRAAGRQLGRRLAEARAAGRLALPFLVTLSGDLGAGKTTLCQGLGQGLEVPDPLEIVSPTFTLANEYHGLMDIFHLDLYRLDTVDQFYEAGLDEYLARPGLTLLEWPEKGPGPWPEPRLELLLEFQGAGRRLKAGPWPEPLF